MGLNVADWAMIVVVGLSTLISLWRGFIREALSLASWILAFFLALVFSERLAYVMGDWIDSAVGRYILAFALLFMVTLVIGALLGHLLRRAAVAIGLGFLDRLLGTVFGAARGILILLALVVVLRPGLGLDETAWWRQSRLMPHLLLMESWFRGTAESVRDMVTV